MKQKELPRTSSLSPPCSLGTAMLLSCSERTLAFGKNASNFPLCSGYKQSGFDTPPPPSPQKHEPWLEAQVASLARVSDPLGQDLSGVCRKACQPGAAILESRGLSCASGCCCDECLVAWAWPHWGPTAFPSGHEKHRSSNMVQSSAGSRTQ